MRALSDQDKLSSTSISNYFRGSRNRPSANTQSSTAEQSGNNDSAYLNIIINLAVVKKQLSF